MALLIGAAFALAAGAAWATSGSSGPPEKIRICHATNSETNPYRSIEVATAGGANGHMDHTGPIFEPGMKDQGIQWGDIIPPFTFDGVEMSLNWPEGMDIWNSNCQLPQPPPDVCPNIPGDQAEVPPGMVIDENGNCVEEVPPTDVCPNIPGDQAEVPPGMVIDDNGNCVESGSGGGTIPSPGPGGGGGSGGGTGPGSRTGSSPGSSAGPDTRTEAGAPLAGGGGGPAGLAPEGPAAEAPRPEGVVPPSAVDAGLVSTSTVSEPMIWARGLVGLGVALMIGAGLVGLGGRRRRAYQA